MKTKLFTLGAAVLVLFLAMSNYLLLRQLRSARAQLAQAEHQLVIETQARADQESRNKALERGQAGLSERLVELSGLAATLRASEAKQASNYARLAKATQATTDKKEGGSDEPGPFDGKGWRDVVENDERSGHEG